MATSVTGIEMPPSAKAVGYYLRYYQEREFWIEKAWVLKLRAPKRFAAIESMSGVMLSDLKIVGCPALHAYHTYNWRSLFYAVEEINNELREKI